MPTTIANAANRLRLDFEPGERVRTDFGKGHIVDRVEGRPGWRWPVYFWVRLTDGKEHLFAPNEIAVRSLHFQ